jgi:hypothetical protein
VLFVHTVDSDDKLVPRTLAGPSRSSRVYGMGGTESSTTIVPSKRKKYSKRNYMSKSQIVRPKSAFDHDGSAPERLSRRARSHNLYVFPVLDRCNSLLFFPVTMTSLINSGNLQELQKLFDARIEKQCNVFVHNLDRVTISDFLIHLKMKNAVHPDSMACVYGTKVVDNQIIATIYFKFTDNQFIYNAVLRSPDLVPGSYQADCLMPGTTRSERYLRIMKPTFAAIEERERVINILDSDKDLIVYGEATLTLTVDDISKKIVSLQFVGDLSRVTEASSPQDAILRR